MALSKRNTLDVLVVGGLNSDYLVRGQRLPRPGQTVQGDTFYTGPGGKGANQAVAAARLGARVALIGKVGAGERGSVLIETLREEGVDVDGILRDPIAPTGTAVITVDARAEKQIMAVPGANAHLSARDLDAFAYQFTRARVVLSVLEIPLATVQAVAQRARQAQASFVLDPAPPTVLSDALLAQVDVIRPNASEAEALTGVAVRDRASASLAARRLLERGARGVVIQAGSKGDLVVWPEGEHFLPRFEVVAIDATGAGDACAAGIAVGLAEGKALVEACRLGSAAAALATTVLGAQPGLPSRAAVEALMAPRGGIGHPA